MLPPMPPFKEAETGRCEVVEYMPGRRRTSESQLLGGVGVSSGAQRGRALD